MTQKYFGAILAPAISASHDVLDAYLAAPTIPSVTDPLSYWQGMASSQDCLARMALDFLSSPGMLVYLIYTLPNHLTSGFN